MRHSIFVTIFFWFWLSMLAVVVSMLVFAAVTGTQVIGHPFLRNSLDFYGRSAVTIYQQHGAKEANDYLDALNHSIGIEATLLDSNGNDFLHRGIPPNTGKALEQTRSQGSTQLTADLRWAGASSVRTTVGNYTFIARMHLLRGALQNQSLDRFLMKSLAGVLAAGLLCFVLARYIARPIRTLQLAARRVADGDLSIRVLPLIRRRDELSDLARDFDRMTERVQSLMKKQQEMLGDISHELRSPLARLNVSLELVRRGKTDSVERMQLDIQRIEELVSQVLMVARLRAEEGQRLVSVSDVELRGLLESIVADAAFEGAREEKTVTLKGNSHCWVRGDATLLRSGMENIVRNAIQYTKPGTSVEIILIEKRTEKEDTALIQVRDHGPAAPDDALERLFEPFYRVSDARDRRTGGTGLGLAISHKVALLHGGAVCARNHDKEGLVVEFTLPATQPQIRLSKDSVLNRQGGLVG